MGTAQCEMGSPQPGNGPNPNPVGAADCLVGLPKFPADVSNFAGGGNFLRNGLTRLGNGDHIFTMDQLLRGDGPVIFTEGEKLYGVDVPPRTED